MNFLSVCSGIEAASCAWHPLGWRAVAFSEIEAFPSAVLAHHYPSVPNWGDMTRFKDWPDANPDVLVGGTPCQAFSVAGLRKGLADPRGNLTLTFLAIADRYRPRWVVWENVPGVLSIDGGRTFGTFLGGLGQLGYGFAYRVLDAQHFGVPQRRRRVFVVGYLGDWRRAAAVLFERESLSGNPAPRREAGEGITGGASRCAEGGELPDVAGCLQERDSKGADSDTKPGHLIPVGFASTNAGPDGVGVQADKAYTLEARTVPQAVAFHENQRAEVTTSDTAGSLKCNGGKPGQGYPATMTGSAVRRLTPRECERLQGFPDDYTLIQVRGKPAADGPRYKALGNSMAVPVMRFIGERIQLAEELLPLERAA